MNTRLIHDGPAYQVAVSATRSTRSTVAIAFDTTWPTARKPERVAQFRMNLTAEEIERLVDFLQDILTPPF